MRYTMPCHRCGFEVCACDVPSEKTFLFEELSPMAKRTAVREYMRDCAELLDEHVPFIEAYQTLKQDRKNKFTEQGLLMIL
jgi:hypothetical protein